MYVCIYIYILITHINLHPLCGNIHNYWCHEMTYFPLSVRMSLRQASRIVINKSYWSQSSCLMKRSILICLQLPSLASAVILGISTHHVNSSSTCEMFFLWARDFLMLFTMNWKVIWYIISHQIGPRLRFLVIGALWWVWVRLRVSPGLHLQWASHEPIHIASYQCHVFIWFWLFVFNWNKEIWMYRQIIRQSKHESRLKKSVHYNLTTIAAKL